MFSAFDWVVLGLYLALSLFIGIWASGKRKDFHGYMFGGGNIPWVVVGISLIATSVSATTFLGNPAETYSGDMRFLMFNFGALLSIIVVWRWFIPRFRESGIVSAYELLEIKFSRPVRRLAALFYSLHLLMRTGILLYAPSIVLATILGVELWVAILLSSVVATIYTWYGGIRAVIWTDVMQFVVFAGAGIVVIVIVANAVGGFESLYSMAHAAGKTTWLDLRWDPSDARTLASAGLAYAVLEIAVRGCDQQFVQRYLSCASVKEANRSSILSMVLGIFVSILFFSVGAALYVYFVVTGHGTLPAGSNVDAVFPHFILHDLPPGVTGLVVAAIYAAAMSSLSSAISALANTTESDILCKDKHADGNLRRAKLFSIAWGLAGIAAAFVAQTTDGSLLKKALFFTGLFTGPLLALFLLAFFRPRTNPHAVIAGVLAGMATLVLFQPIPILPAWHPPFVNVVSWPWNPLISLSGTIVFAIVLDWIIPRKHVNLTA